MPRGVQTGFLGSQGLIVPVYREFGLISPPAKTRGSVRLKIDHDQEKE